MQQAERIVIIPTYNERENIENIIRAVMGLEGGYHILVVEDGSPDGTAAIVRQLQGEFAGRLHMVERSGKLGLGTAYIAGFRWALERGYEYIFNLDSGTFPFIHPSVAEDATPYVLEKLRYGDAVPAQLPAPLPEPEQPSPSEPSPL